MWCVDHLTKIEVDFSLSLCVRILGYTATPRLCSLAIPFEWRILRVAGHQWPDAPNFQSVIDCSDQSWLKKHSYLCAWEATFRLLGSLNARGKPPHQAPRALVARQKIDNSWYNCQQLAISFDRNRCSRSTKGWNGSNGWIAAPVVATTVLLSTHFTPLKTRCSICATDYCTITYSKIDISSTNAQKKVTSSGSVQISIIKQI